MSYDVGQTAIVWDLFTGQEVSRFASFEHIGVAAWMRNGNVAFGRFGGKRTIGDADSRQETIREKSFFLNHRRRSIFLLGRYSILLLRLRRLRTVELMQLGM